MESQKSVVFKKMLYYLALFFLSGELVSRVQFEIQKLQTTRDSLNNLNMRKLEYLK